MPTATINPEDLSSAQLAELGDKLKAAEQERDNRQRFEQGQRQLIRRAHAKLQRVDSEINTLRADRDAKAEAIVPLHERLQAVEEMNEHDPAVRDERAALVDALDMATDRGAPVVSGAACPSNLPAYRLLFDAAPNGTNWHTPIATLATRLETLTAERDRLRKRLAELEDDAGEVAA